MADKFRLILLYPITGGDGKTITSLSIKRLKRRDLTAAAKYSTSDVEQEDFLFAKMVDLTIEDFAELDITDATRVRDTFLEMAKGADLAEILGRSAAAGPADAAV